jgi:hypothetical protein
MSLFCVELGWVTSRSQKLVLAHSNMQARHAFFYVDKTVKKQIKELGFQI